MPIQKSLTTQVDLKHTLQRLFPDKNIVTNARKLGQISSQSSGLYLELDFYIPDDKISFEFQDPYHYATSWTYSPLQKTQEADGLKQKSVSERGETLIIVPCWWRGDDESLIATIREQRQDLFPKKLSSKPIPLVPPVELIQGCDIPGVGELMLATFAMSSSDFTNWWESEKYDGMRMCWNPKVKSLYNQYDPVSFPLLKFPDCFLDGEIWFGRGSFTESQPSHFGNVNWPLLRFVSFDCPDVASCNLPFEDRFHLLLESVPSSHPFVIISAQKKSENRAQMRNNITMVLEDGGEGIVLRQPLSVYQHGRSNYLVKFKASRDAEALVVHDLGVGWFLLQLPNQVQFEAKETQNKLIYGDKIKKGEVVTFSYDAYGKEGIPKNAKIVRKRPEISWMNVVYNFSKERHAKSLNNVTISSLSETTTRNPQGYWTDSLKEGNKKDNSNNEISNLRKFFVDIAKERNMDPLLPENWYSLRNREIRQYKGASAVLFHFQSSLSKALLEAFPEIGLKIEDFHRHSFKYWNNVENRKKFFDMFAKEKKFDPLKPQNWQSVTINQIHKIRGGTSVLSYYEGSLQKALLDLYPSFNVLGSHSPSYFAWRSLSKRKQFLDNFADKRGFDPLVPANWCSILSKDLLSEENAKSFLARYKNSLYNAIMDVYPSIGISNHLQRNPKNFFANKENRKQFFDNIALKLQFDPQQMNNWFPLGNYRIAQEKGGATVLGYYSHSLQNALSDIYGFDYPNSDELQEYKTARYFFDSHAKRHSFDPLEPKNWYNLLQKPTPKVQEHLSAKFRFSIANTLSSIYPNVSFNVSMSEKK